MRPPEIRRLLAQLGVKPRRRLGQHFLVDIRVAARHVAYARVRPSETVLEIGPGLGILTSALVRVAKRVVAIETDRRFAGHLRDTVPEAEILVGDAVSMDWPSFDVAVSNLPYQISSPVTFRLLRHPFARAILMYQWEFARRMVAPPGTPEYSRLSVGVYRRAACEILERVPPNAFHPQPRVASALVRLEPRPPPFPLSEPDLYDAVVGALFEHRRKTIENGLRLGWPSFGRAYGPFERLLPSLPFRGRRIGELRPEEIESLVESIAGAKA